MNEGWLSYRCAAALMVGFLCSGLLCGCSQRPAPQQALGLPERSLAREPEIKVRLFDLAQFSCEVGTPSTITRLEESHTRENSPFLVPQQKLAPLGYCSGEPKC